ncbi:MAG: M15 family metallopeptidase [Oscillospiraceae bacterium]|nr:M15 family metallopeptidase [Oscillospiraceae bacterium]
MKTIFLLSLTLFLLAGCARNNPEETTMQSISDETTLAGPTVHRPTETELLMPLIDPKSSDFVRVTDYVPNVIVDLKYSGTDNFTGQEIYGFDDAFLRYGTVKKLKAVSDELAQQGLQLKIWDAFRPVSAQFRLWEICPDDTYVADPNKGYSNHSRGFAVDVTLVNSEGRELEMPTGFDDFSAMADRDYSDCSPEATENARLLESVMAKHGLSGYQGEWWHFSDDHKYEVETCFDPEVIARRYLAQNAVLVERYWVQGSRILTIPDGEPVTILGYSEEYAMVEYWGYRGYIPTACLMAE